MKELIILGTGVHSAEMAHIVERINRECLTWKILGHIAPKGVEQTEFAGNPVLGSAENMDELLARYPTAMLVADNEFPKSVAVPAERRATRDDHRSELLHSSYGQDWTRLRDLSALLRGLECGDRRLRLHPQRLYV